MASEWDTAPLDDLVDDILDRRGVTPLKLGSNFVSTGYRVISAKAIKRRRVDLAADEPRFVDQTTYQKWMRTPLRADDVILTSEAPLGEPAYVSRDVDWCLGQRLFGIRSKKTRLHGRFLFYALQSEQVRHDLLSRATGTTAQGIRQTELRRVHVPLPEMGEQRAIAYILGTLDDKIELNRRMNETLEAIARGLFNSWFVNFDPVRAKAEGRNPGLPQSLTDLFPGSFEASKVGETPKGWEVGPLGRFFKMGLSGAWGEDEESNRSTVSVRCMRGIDCHELAEGRIPDVPVRWVSPKQAADRQLADGTLLIEGSGSFCGRSMIWRRAYGQLLGEPIGYSNFCKRLDPICSAGQAVVCWMQLRQAYRDGLLQSFRTGTAFPNFDVHGALATLLVVVPPVPLADAYARLFESSQRLDLMAQSCTLAALRDTLLPKLLSGELRISDATSFLRDPS
jgi:type I restriction enzyme S subunit